MYPCVQPGDTLHIESRLIEGVKVGDIAVFRRDGNFFGHRTIAKGGDEVGAYIVTRPDRSHHNNDGPTYGENILGVVTRIERRGKPASSEPKPLKGYAQARVTLWEWWNWDGRLRLSKRLGRVQRLRLYKIIASMGMKALHPQRRYKVRTPLKLGQSHDLYRVFSPDQFDVTQPLQQGKPVMEFTLELSFSPKRPLAASITLIRNPEENSQGAIWQIANSWVRNRYHGAGFEDMLARQAEKILARGGARLGKPATERRKA